MKIPNYITSMNSAVASQSLNTAYSGSFRSRKARSATTTEWLKVWAARETLNEIKEIVQMKNKLALQDTNIITRIKTQSPRAHLFFSLLHKSHTNIPSSFDLQSAHACQWHDWPHVDRFSFVHRSDEQCASNRCCQWCLQLGCKPAESQYFFTATTREM